MKRNIILAVLIFIIGCTHETKEPPSCTEFSPDCELKKEWCLIKVISLIDTSSIDALGRNLKVGEWYLRNSKVRTLMPFVDEPQDYSNITHQNLEAFERHFPDVSSNPCKV